MLSLACHVQLFSRSQRESLETQTVLDLGSVGSCTRTADEAAEKISIESHVVRRKERRKNGQYEKLLRKQDKEKQQNKFF